MKTLALAAALACLTPFDATDEEDRKAIEDAVLGYVDAFYRSDPELITRNVHPELDKYGLGRWGDQTEYAGYRMTFDDLRGMADGWNEEGRAGADAPREVTILDQLDKTAEAKLVAWWGVDYLQLAKLDGRWRIVHVLWQTVGAPEGVDEVVDAEADRKAIERAVLDYVESAYEVRPENIDRSVHPELAKLGFTRRAPEDAWKRHDMDFASLRALVAEWNKDGKMPKDARKDVVVLDQLDRTAAARAHAYWGIDFFHLLKDAEGEWKIRQVLWQSHPLDLEAPEEAPARESEAGRMFGAR